MADIFLDFKYFKAPSSHSLLYPGYECEVKKCSFCACESDYILNEDDKPGCINCLKDRKFSLRKYTEIGQIEDGVLFTSECTFDFSQIRDRHDIHKIDFSSLSGFIERTELEVPAGFDKASLIELCHTPDVSCFQDIYHPVHCNDFMVYIGRWEMEDFVRNAPDGGGERLFKEMNNDEEFDHLWEWTLEEKAGYDGNWSENYEYSNWADGACVYVFECLHCKMKRCTWDME